jgi:lipid-A-disaccharide synthase
VALLPGSRGHEVHDNMPVLRHSARRIAAQRPDVRFLVAAFRPHQRDWLQQQLAMEDLEIEFHSGRTPEIMALADACIAVSGSVGLELLYRELPTVVIYRTHFIYRRIVIPLVSNVPHFSIVNLLAGRELYPEYLLDVDEPNQPSDHVVDWLNDSAAREAMIADLRELKLRVARPGACATAARWLVDHFAAAHRQAA